MNRLEGKTAVENVIHMWALEFAVDGGAGAN